MLKFKVETVEQPRIYTVTSNNDTESPKTSSLRIVVKQQATKPLKVPPPVKAKPKKPARVNPPPTVVSDPLVEDDFPAPPPPDALIDDSFPAPPPSEMNVTTPTSPADKSLEDELDALTEMLALGLDSAADPDFYGVCYKCRSTITGEGNGCTAMQNMYHVSCFTCIGCKTRLTGMEFYCVDNEPYCEKCYMNSLEECIVCKEKISDRILRAVGGVYHPQCFACASCQKNLDGIPFTLDAANTIHCVECYQLKFSPRCAACQKLIMPTNQRGETVHIVSMQKNYHVECYKCEDCGELLSSEEGRGCYPLNGRLLCQRCNGLAQSKKGPRLSTEL